MTAGSSNLRGIIYMVLASGCFTINNGLLKAAVVHLPPLEALFLRAVAAVILGMPVLLLTAPAGSLRHMLGGRVLARNVVECAAAIAFVFAVANAPLADLTALLQLTPILVLLGAVVFFGDKVGGATAGLIVVALIGALLVAQPGAAGFQPYVLFGLLSAALSAGRDLIGRRVEPHVPALAVAIGLSLVSALGIGALMLVFERWVTPSWPELLLIAAASAFLTLARAAAVSVVPRRRDPGSGTVLLHRHAMGAARRFRHVQHLARWPRLDRHRPDCGERRAGAAARWTPQAACGVAAISAADRAYQNVRLAPCHPMR